MHAAGLWLLLLLSLFSIPGKEGVPFGEDAKDASSRGKDEVDATALLQKIMGTTLGTTSGLQDYNPKDWPTPEQYLAAAGWHVRDEIKRLPVIFIPPFSGTRILQKIQDRPVKSPMDFFCERSSEGKWKNLWLPTKDEVGESIRACYLIHLLLSPTPAAMSSRPALRQKTNPACGSGHMGAFECPDYR